MKKAKNRRKPEASTEQLIVFKLRTIYRFVFSRRVNNVFNVDQGSITPTVTESFAKRKNRHVLFFVEWFIKCLNSNKLKR